MLLCSDRSAVCVTMFPLVIGKENLELDRQGLCSFFLYLH